MKKIDKIISFIFLITIIAMIISLAQSYAKYQEKITAEDTAEVAVPIIKLIDDEVIQIKISPQNKETSYKFKVTNTEGEKTSEVTMRYYLQIKSLENLPLNYELYKYENGQVGNTNLLKENQTEYIEMKMQSTEDEYLLKINWGEDNNYKYSKVLDYIQIKLHSEQID